MQKCLFQLFYIKKRMLNRMLGIEPNLGKFIKAWPRQISKAGRRKVEHWQSSFCRAKKVFITIGF